MSEDRATMNAERFAALAAAYGGELRRWPKAEQAASVVFARTEEARAILRRAGNLDAMLDTYGVRAPDRALQANVLRIAKEQVSKRRRVRLWWLGFGLAGVGLAGAIAGSVVVTIVTPQTRSDHYAFGTNVTAFGDAGPEAGTIEEEL